MASDRAQHVAAEVTRLANLPASLLTSAATREPVWLRVGTLLDGTSTTPAHDVHLVYDATAIRFVGRDGRTPPRALLRPNQTTPDFVAPDHTLLPGLIEAHAHLFLEGGELNLDKRAAYLKQTPSELVAAARARLEKIVRLGVVAVRDAGDKDGVGLALSKQYKDARSVVGPVSDRTKGQSKTGPTSSLATALLMPYLDSPGAAIHHRGRYGSFMGEPLESFPTPQACVAARVAAGADRIKLIPTGIINFKVGAVTTEPQMSAAEVAALVTAAKSFGKQTFAHASGDKGIENVVEGGADSVEHGFFIRDDQLARMRDRQIAWVPTFAPVQEQIDHAALMGWDAAIVAHLQRILDQHAASLVRAHALGVQVIAGSDAGSVGVAHAVGLLDELVLMERAGLPSLSVINAATGVSANRLGYREKFGRIEPGCLSRFILTRHSPLETVANLRRPRTIVFDGEALKTNETANCDGL